MNCHYPVVKKYLAMETPYIVSVQVGKVRIFGVESASEPMDKPWSSGYAKEPVDGRIWLDRCGLSGDGQADLRNHGGAEKAVLAYPADHYPDWRVELNRQELPFGAFGENFTVMGHTEKTVCIGDTYSAGETRFQISQPRQPCWKISRYWGIGNLAEQVKSTGRIGWYLRVLDEGYVERGFSLVLLDRPFPRWTVACAYEIMKNRHKDKQSALELASCPLLSLNWRTTLSS